MSGCSVRPRTSGIRGPRGKPAAKAEKLRNNIPKTFPKYSQSFEKTSKPFYCTFHLPTEPLVRAARIIRWEVERGQYPGYTSVVIEDKGVALWWKGALPQQQWRTRTSASRSRTRAASP